MSSDPADTARASGPAWRAPPTGASSGGRPALPRVGRFTVTGELGRGGMGVVWRGWDPELARPVAIKTVDARWSDEETRARFVREARASARLRHPHIVGVFEVGLAGTQPYLVMEYVPGETLEDRRRRGPLPAREVARIAREVALALAHAHSLGVIHRDVKPANVLLDQGGAAHLTDFGLARLASRITVTGDVLGTPAYMAPEQAGADRGEQGPATDVWGIGGILYHALTGRAPFAREDPYSALQAVLSAEPEPPRALAPEADPDLETVALRCLEKEPALRYASAEQVAEELARFLRGDPIRARPVGPLRRLARSARRNALTVGLAALALVAVTVALALALDRARRRETPTPAAARPSAPPDTVLERTLARARRGELADRARFEKALFALVRAADEGTAARLGAELDALSAELRDAFRERLHAAAAPEDDRARARLDEAIDVWLSPTFHVVRDRARLGPLLATADALLPAWGGAGPSGPRDTAHWLPIVAAAQQERVGAGRLTLARLCCEALGRLESPRAGEPLVRYLLAEADGARAAEAAIALYRLRLADAGRMLLLGQGRFGTSGPFWERISATLDADDPALNAGIENDGAALTVRARLYQDRGDLESARADLLRATEIAPDLAEAWNNLGAVAVLTSRWEEALACLDRAIALRPGYGLARHNRANARMSLGRLDEALVDAHRAVELSPDFAPAWALRGRIRLLRGELRPALDDVARALELDERLPRAWDDRGVIHLELGDLGRAIAAFSRSIALEARVPDPWCHRAVAHQRNGDLASALSDLEQAIRISPDDAKILSDLGFMRLMAGGDTGRALADLDRAIALAPENAEAHRNRGHVRTIRGDRAGARADYDRAIELEPGYVDAWVGRATLRQRDDPPGALADAEQALRLDDRNLSALLVLGGVLGRLGRAREALAALDRAVAIDPAHGRALALRGLAHRDLGDRQRARADMERALEVGIDNAGVEAATRRELEKLR